jgi:hypothetical protein
MAAETFNKRQKEAARREKQQRKFARRLEKKKAKTESSAEQGQNPQIIDVAFKRGPTIL